MDKSLSPNRPYRVGFLLIDGFALMSYAAAIEPLRAANLLAGRRLYDIRHIAAVGDSAKSSSGAIVEATDTISERTNLELVVVVAGGDPMMFRDEKVFQWLRHLSRHGVHLGGVSGGPVILAAAGVMSQRRMTVHWEHATALAAKWPDLLLERSLYVVDRDRVTCAGGIAAVDMMHALLDKHYGPLFTRQVSDWFMHTDVRPSGGPQRAGLSERYGVTNGQVILAIEAMENRIADPLNLEQLARQIDISPRQLNRLFRDKLNKSTMGFYRELRLNKARRLLAQSPLTITEIALATGFANSAHFAHVFHTTFGAPPSSLRH